MTTTIRAVFDGEVLRPEQPVDLRTDTTYLVTLEAEASEAGDARAAEAHPLTGILRLAVDMGMDDLSTRHDWYAHGRLPDDSP